MKSLHCIRRLIVLLSLPHRFERKTPTGKLRIVVFGAHPDDAQFKQEEVARNGQSSATK
jgi:hypothetical protein